MLSASLIQLEYASKHWKSTFSYSERTRTPEGSAPATRRGPELSTAGRRPEGEQEGRGATPPPRPPTGLQAAGAPAPTPRGRRDGPPPARERSRSATRPPAPAAGSHGGREEQASPRLRARTPHRSYPEKPGEHKPEWYGGPRPPSTAKRQRHPLCGLPGEGRGTE